MLYSPFFEAWTQTFVTANSMDKWKKEIAVKIGEKQKD